MRRRPRLLALVLAAVTAAGFLTAQQFLTTAQAIPSGTTPMPPDDQQRLDMQTFLTTHNAFNWPGAKATNTISTTQVGPETGFQNQSVSITA